MVWANDNKTLFYVTKDKLDRPHKVRFQRLAASRQCAQHMLPALGPAKTIVQGLFSVSQV